MRLTTSLLKCPEGLHGEIVTPNELDTGNLFKLTNTGQNSVFQHYKCWSAVSCLVNAYLKMDTADQFRKLCSTQVEVEGEGKCDTQVEVPNDVVMNTRVEATQRFIRFSNIDVRGEVFSKYNEKEFAERPARFNCLKMNSTPTTQNLESIPAQNASNAARVVCFYCNKPGHYAYNCWTNPESRNFKGANNALRHYRSTSVGSQVDPSEYDMFQVFLKEKREKDEIERMRKVLKEMGIAPVQPTVTVTTTTSSTTSATTVPAINNNSELVSMQVAAQIPEISKLQKMLYAQQEELRKLKIRNTEVSKKIVFDDTLAEDKEEILETKYNKKKMAQKSPTKIPKTEPIKRKAEKSPEEKKEKKTQKIEKVWGPLNTGNDKLDLVVSKVMEYGPKPTIKDKENRLNEVVDLLNFNDESGEQEEIEEKEKVLWNIAKVIFNVQMISDDNENNNARRLIVGILNKIKDDLYSVVISLGLFDEEMENAQEIVHKINNLAEKEKEQVFKIVARIEQQLYSKCRRNWKTIAKTMFCKSIIGISLNRKWLKNMKKDNILEFWPDKKNAIYGIVNTKGKKVYVGRTTTKISTRWQRHMQAIKDKENRRIYSYINSIGIENFFIIPLEYPEIKGLNNKMKEQKLDWTEQQWIKRFRHNTLNSVKGIYNMYNSKLFNNNRSISRKQRLIKIQEMRRLKRTAIMILRSTLNFQELQNEELVEILLLIEHAGFSKRQKHVLSHKLKKEAKKRGIDLCKNTTLVVPNIKQKDKQILLQDIIDKLASHFGYTAARQLTNNMKIVSSNAKSIRDIVCNRKKYLLKSYMKDITCSCNRFSNLIRNEEKHVMMKAIDLDDNHMELKKLLLMNSNTRVEMSKGRWEKLAIERTEAGLQKLTGRKIACTELYRNKEQVKCAIDEKTIKNILRRYKGLLFTEIDKNPYQWVIACPCTYLKKVMEHFEDKHHYTKEDIRITEANNLARKNYVENGLEEIVPFKKNGVIGNAYILPKDKDINKIRPIVSYYKHGCRKLGRMVARALTVLIKRITSKDDPQLNSTKILVKRNSVITSS